MNSSIDVSIIIPVYNGAETIGALVAQLICERKISIEIIIVDDGSNDRTSHVIGSIEDDRIILLRQENQGVYAARNAALAIHRGEWLIFLDADDEVSEGFVYARWQKACTTQADVTIFNAWRLETDGKRRAVHVKQPYGLTLTGHEWLRHCVTHREWPHYLWLQIIRSSFLSKYNQQFRSGKSHKDILWTIGLAVSSARFCIVNKKDYIYRINPASITNRSDYYDVRALSYIDVMAEIIRFSKSPHNRAVKIYLRRHALVEARHFLGLYRNNVIDRAGIRSQFRASISLMILFQGISSVSDVLFWLKLFIKIV